MQQSSTEKKDVLARFHPLVRQWFSRQLGTPTDIQARAWPEIAAGKHVLVTAPTGSGKTLTAFLWAINRFLEEKGTPEQNRVLYISPLKALNNDIQRNLEGPLQELKACFETAGIPFPEIRTAVRSGDTEPSQRRQMVRRPPEIFITTPESLNILLASRSGRQVLTGISTVILDEIHAVVPNKRGTYLITAVERLVPLCGEFQRIALSATVRPQEAVAEFVGGYRARKSGGDYTYERRRVAVVKSDTPRRYDIGVHIPDRPADIGGKEDWWRSLVAQWRQLMAQSRSSLFFTNSRRLVEKVTRLINEAEGENRVYSHHGSLAKEIRAVVERRFKEGELSAIVATSSLELGIDIGSVDQVVLIQAPFSVSSAIQRIGRAGHGVGQVSRGIFAPLHRRDFLEAAVLAAQIDVEAIEEMRPLKGSLDVLAQAILSLTLLAARDIDDLYGEIRAAYPYHDLKREEFDLVVEMLAGRYADSRIRELKPRLLVDQLKNTAKARESTASLIYLSGGVIPDRGYYNLRVADSKAKIGELDEEFVWERSLGDAFPMGNQIWRIVRITHNDVEVVQVPRSNSLVPFWRAEEMNRSFHLSQRIGGFLEAADTGLEDAAFRQKLLDQHHMSEGAADELIRYLKEQRSETGAALPHRRHLLVEHFQDPANVTDAKQTVLHTFWGGRVNRPFAFALAAAWEETYGYPLEVFVNNDCIMLNLPHAFGAADLFALVGPEQIFRRLRQKLESTGYFGARFRENAQRALLLPRRGFHQRMPLWLNRLRSKKLLEAVSRYDNFPILLETWRDCLNHDFEIDALVRLLEEIRAGEIKITEAVTAKPSPFAEGIIWRQTSYYMYLDDTPGSKLQTNLSDRLFKEVIYASHLRPRFAEDLIETFARKLQRLYPGYAPGSAEELLLWVQERQYIPAAEWDELLSALKRDHQVKAEEVVKPIEDRLHYRKEKGVLSAVMAAEQLPRIDRALHSTDADDGLTGFLAEWLRFYGPVSQDFVRDTLMLPAERLSAALDALVEEGSVIVDQFRPEGPLEICDTRNVEILLRLQRAAARPVFEPLEIETLPLFLAAFHGLTAPGEGLEALQQRLEQLFGCPAKAALWESDILPARLSPYYTAWLDTAMRQNELIWFGCGRERIGFCFESDYELFAQPVEQPGGGNGGDTTEAAARLERLFSRTIGKLALEDIAAASQLPSRQVSAALWHLAFNGRITNDDYQTVRSGIMNRFKAEVPAQTERSRGRRPRRIGFNRWQSSRPFSGNWYTLKGMEEESIDALDRQEIVKDRIRQLLLRYGILFREILGNELPGLRWADVFPVLRLMELSGEITSGHFFKGIPGLQFCSPAALRLLQQGLPEEAVYWLNAADPASPCGIYLEDLKGQLPHRLATTHLVFQGRVLVLVSRKNGQELEFRVEADHPRLGDYLEFFKVLIGRQFQPSKYISVETVNQKPVLESPYRHALQEFGFHRDYKSMVLMKKY